MIVWTIYCHTHVESGRRYVGLTKMSMMRRWNRHVYCAMKSLKGTRTSHFPNAIRKYGPLAFSHEVLETCHSLEEANAAEERWIAHHDTRNPEKGFNLTKGGSHTPHPVKNPWDRPEFRAKMEGLSKKTWSDPAFRARHSQAVKDAHKDPEYRRKKSERAKKQWSDPESRPKQLEANKKKASSSEFRNKARSNWNDPSFRARCSIPLRARDDREASKTHCKHGHEYTVASTKLSRGGNRECRICIRTRKNSKKTHCPNGHELKPGGFYLNKSGARLCSVCGSRPLTRSGPCVLLMG